MSHMTTLTPDDITLLLSITPNQIDIIRVFMAVIHKDGRVNVGRKSPNGLKDYSHLSQCWGNTTGASSAGYGQISINRKAWQLHRLSWWIHNGFPDESHNFYLTREYHITHECDNPECSNPEHLSLKPVKENVQEAVERVKKVKGPKKQTRAKVACNACRKDTHHKCEGFPCSSCVKKNIECVKVEYVPPPQGFKKGDMEGGDNNNAILTAQQVIEIRTRIQKGLKHGELKKMAEDYGISYPTIQAIKNGRLWNKPDYFPFTQ